MAAVRERPARLAVVRAQGAEVAPVRPAAAPVALAVQVADRRAGIPQWVALLPVPAAVAAPAGLAQLARVLVELALVGPELAQAAPGLVALVREQVALAVPGPAAPVQVAAHRDRRTAQLRPLLYFSKQSDPAAARRTGSFLYASDGVVD